MGAVSIHQHFNSLASTPHPMIHLSTGLQPPLRLFVPKFRCLCSSSPISLISKDPIRGTKCEETLPKATVRVKTKSVLDAQLKADWLRSLSCPLPENPPLFTDSNFDSQRNNAGSEWVLGIDPDTSGAVALLKPDASWYSVQVFDSPRVKVLIGKRIRHRLDAKSMVQLIKSFDAPIGTTAYIEQSIPYPKDGKQGWWSGGFGYGLWIGVLVASGYSVVPVPSCVWKNEHKLSGNHSSKDDSRKLASTLFPSMIPLLKRKKDHGRAEALLIAAYGKDLRMNYDIPSNSTELMTDSLVSVGASNS